MYHRTWTPLEQMSVQISVELSHISGVEKYTNMPFVTVKCELHID